MTRPLDELFFEYFLPDVTGHAKIIDEYLSNMKAQYHETAKNDKIVFHDDPNKDPDWGVKQAYLIMMRLKMVWRTCGGKVLLGDIMFTLILENT